MTIEAINDKLAQVAEETVALNRRSKLLELSFAIMDWMGIAPNGDYLPQIVAPKTQRLHEYLLHAPLTKQGQLYRMSANTENIRIRFAVLKKLKKEYISQLVDNDPGLTSYQAFTKNLTIPAGHGYVPSQPYFIHFVTTPDYDRLVLIFTRGEQKRLISFRNRLTQTQFSKIVSQWQGINKKSKAEITAILWKSLDIKEVNKEFYKQVKERFDALVGILKAEQSGAAENDIKQFTVRLIGRYIFCWFLKEKGVIPPNLLSSANISQTPSFDKTILVPLFFNILNTPIAERDFAQSFTPVKKDLDRIPYLNGGLFEKHPEDDLFEHLDLDAWLKKFVEILEGFDFTVDESSSQYQQVAIDPEMLGRIFENLLASQNPETEKMANQRNAYGAFYTPREIVDYMVNESLKAYLETRLLPSLPYQPDETIVSEPEVAYSGTLFQQHEPQQLRMNLSDKQRAEVSEAEKKREKLKEKIEKFLSPACAESPFDKEETQKVRKTLTNIKVLDPACGSGAFPMGMLFRLKELRQIVGHSHKSTYDLKNEILSKNIFGIDIMPMAVEIARLRAWLSLVLDADYNPADRKNNYGIAALPNLDFRFVCANSLIDVPANEYVENMAYNELKEFEELTEEYFNSSLEEKTELKRAIENCINRITELHAIAIDRWQEQIRKEKNSSNKARLNTLKQKQQEYEWERSLWQSYKNIFNNHKVDFFNTRYFFPAVTDGFDVVIGNPPYINISNLKPNEYRLLLRSLFRSAKNKSDTYAFFLESGFSKLQNNGILSYIIPQTWKATDSFSKLREIIFKEKSLGKVVDLDFGTFDAIVKPMVVLISNQFGKYKSIQVLNDSFEHVYEIDLDEILQDSSLSLNTSIGQNQKLIFKKIENDTVKLEKVIQFSRGIKTSDDDRFILMEARNKDCKKVFRGKNIKRYQMNWDGEFVWYRPDLMKEKVGSVSYTKSFFEVPEKLVTQRVNSSMQLLCAYDHEQNYFLDTTNLSRYETWDKQTSLKFLCATLNSKLINYWYCNKYRMPTIGIYEIHTIPIKKITSNQQKPLIALVDKILSAKSKNPQADTSKYEREIDLLVYHLYGLSYEEARLIDAGLGEEEFGKYKI
ncbi:MAG: TaqI-like C-terminal specificity domain-containing protein [Chitinophagaceae bacterium]|nr:TaqI-like C-terminal specificity domain-containing protein [Chitinophagaceae bacterium]